MPDSSTTRNEYQEREISLTDNARAVLERRYLRKGEDGQPIETVEEMFHRVSSTVAAVDADYGQDAEQTTQDFYDLLTHLRFFPNSPTFTGAGTPLGQLAACFVIPIEDDMGRDPAGIFSTLRNAALIQQTGGGNGFSFSRLRPKDARVSTSGGMASGPVSFLKMYDAAFGAVHQGGVRRGANMAVLRVDHPDVQEFIRCKAHEGDLANFNISVGITDEFMRAVENDEDFDLVNPQDGSVWETVRARDLFDEFVQHAHHNGEPGVLFLDTANRSNPVPHLYELEATNPCVTGDTLIYTATGLRRAREVAAKQQPISVVVDGRFSHAGPDYGSQALRDHVETLQPASHVFPTGMKDVYRVTTHEGYELRLTANHKVMTPNGWVEARNLRPDDEVYILNRPGAFGTEGTKELGLVLGWLVGDGTVNQVRAVLSFFGEEKAEIAPTMAQAVTAVVDVDRTYSSHPTRNYPVGLTEIAERDEVRIQSDRLGLLAAEYGLDEEKLQVPDVVFKGTETMQLAFLQALFTADGTVLDGGAKGGSVRLTSVRYGLLQDVQRLLLNFGIASRIYRERRSAGMRQLPDGQGGYAEYHCQAYHELAISKDNLLRFAERIGFLSNAKQGALVDYLDRLMRGPYRERFIARVAEVEYDGKEIVYDLSQPTTNSFVANGIVVHNCGEQWLGPYENCCLGSINLAQHVTEQGDIDWEKLRDTIERATHFLDNVVSANKYVPAVPELEKAAHTARRIGLGVMGLADLMYHAGVRYGSEDGEELAAQVMEFVRFHCMRTSIKLARRRGPFPAIKGSIYDPNHLKWKPPTPLTPYERDFGRPALDWNEIVEGIERYGIRNAAQTTIAPTGTIATVAGCEGYGCEPVFALAYIRHVQDGEEEMDLQYTSPLFEKALIEAGIDEEMRQEIYNEVMRTGTCQHIEAIPEHIRHTFVVASDITPEEHVRMQAVIQRFVDNSISKCVTGDTLVMTAEGLRPIAALSDVRRPDRFEPLAIDLVTPAGKEKTDAFYYGSFRETRKIRFSYGFELEGTPNHRIQVLSADGTVEWRRLDELKIGDTAVLYTGQFSFGQPGQNLPAYSGEFRTCAKAVQFPTHISVDLAFLLGCVVSEGAITQNGVMITNSDRELLERLATLFKRLFDLDSYILRDLRRESLFTLQVNSRPLRNWLLADLGMEAGAENKIIPLCIWQASRDEQAAFMRGLMLDGYVTADGRMWGLNLASRELVRQVQTLLLNFDIVGRMHRTGEKAWTVSVSGGKLEKLSDFISFEEKWKMERLARRNRGRQQRYRSYSQLLPEVVTTELRQMQQMSEKSLRVNFGGQTPAYQRTRVNLLQGHRLEREDGHRVFQHFAREATPFAANFFGQDNENKVYVTVEAVETGFSEVFDVSVPGSHSFVANGFGNHNTCNFPRDATPDDVAQAYTLAWELGCKGLTVYVTGTREKVVLETQETQEAKSSHSAPQPPGHQVQEAPPSQIKKPRPRKLRGFTYKQVTPLGTAYVNVTEDKEGHPFEVFLNVGKGGSDTAAAAEAIGRLISLVLRLPSPRSPEERLREVIAELSDIGGGRTLGFGADRVSSLPDGVAQALAEHLGQPEVPAPPLSENPGGNGAARFTDDYCPECGQATLVREEGCRKCYTCGFSEC